MNSYNNLFPVRVMFPDKRLGVRVAPAFNPRLVNDVVVADVKIEGTIVLAYLHEESGEYVPCNKNLQPAPFCVKSTSRIRAKTTRLGRDRM